MRRPGQWSWAARARRRLRLMRADYRRELEQLRRLHEREKFPRNRAQRRAWEVRQRARRDHAAFVERAGSASADPPP